MPTSRGRVNRGPAAATGNREAILRAARRVLADSGYRVPLSAVARAAGVGQAVFYRHFPTRLDLAFAVFEENFTELEALALDPGPDTFDRLWSQLVELTITASAFVEMVVDARDNLPEYDGLGRLLGLVRATLPQAQAVGRADPELAPEDVLLAWRMVFGVVVTATGSGQLRPAVDRALTLLPLPHLPPS